VDFERAYGCSRYVHWKIEFAMIWAVIGLMMPRPKEPTRWNQLEVD
jgi:hypothetical protein